MNINDWFDTIITSHSWKKEGTPPIVCMYLFLLLYNMMHKLTFVVIYLPIAYLIISSIFCELRINQTNLASNCLELTINVYYRNTFKLREMYYQYTHVVENNAQHKWRAERVTRAVHYSPPHACIGNTSQAIYKYLYYIYFIK